MVGIKHSKEATKPHDPEYDVSSNDWNAEHVIDDGSIPIVKLSDHDKAAHDALNINASTLEGSTKAQVQDHSPKEHGNEAHNPDFAETTHEHDATYIAKSIGTVKGDLIAFSASGTPQKVSAGSNDQVLTADSAQAAGVKWATPAGGGESENIVRTTADVTNSTTTFANVTGLTFAIGANEDYIFEAWLIFQSNTATTGIKFACNGPASPVAVVLNAHIPIALTLYASDSMMASRAYDTGTPSVSVDTVNSNLLAEIRGIIRNGANAGTFAIRFAAETTGTVKVMTGSVLRYRKVA